MDESLTERVSSKASSLGCFRDPLRDLRDLQGFSGGVGLRLPCFPFKFWVWGFEIYST